MLAGHNRQNAAAIANRELPCIVKENLSDEDAWIYVIETNVLQRSFSEMLPSEKAAVLTLRYSKMICQGRRNDIVEELKRLENPDEIRENGTCGIECHKSKSRDVVGAEYDLKGRAVANYAYYLLPFSMIVVCVMIAGRETGNNGILKMLALPVSRCTLSIAKFCVLTFYLFMEMVVFLVVFVIAGLIATQTMGVTETLPILYLLKWCLGLFLTMLPCIAAMWAITVLFEKPLLSVGLNLLLVIPGVLVANTPLWIAYPYCYSGYLVSCSLHDFTAETSDAAFSMFPFLPCAIVVFGLFFALAVTQFGKKEMR